MNDITQLAPQTVWQWFAKICAIPHPSFHEAELVQFIIDQVQTEGKSRGMTVERDSKNNLHITKPASKGMENRAPVALQAHCDMVAQKPMIPPTISSKTLFSHAFKTNLCMPITPH